MAADEERALMNRRRSLESLLVFLFPNELARFNVEDVEEAHVISENNPIARDHRLTQDRPVGFEAPSELWVLQDRISHGSGKSRSASGDRP